MSHGTFVWADLSTFRFEKTQRFYADVMGWTFADGVAHTNGPVAAIYTMPEKFQSIGMPSFWMSYIAVTDVAEVAERAQTLGGKVELGPVAYDQGQIALVRDPLGAGFTIYSGPDFAVTASGAAARAGHGLFVSDVGAIRAFYEALFGWRFGSNDNGVYPVSLHGEHLFYCHEIPDPAIRGQEEYWAVYFASPDRDVLSRLESAGGAIVAHMDLPEGAAALARDPDGGHFVLLLEQDGKLSSSTNRIGTPWKAWIGIALIVLLSVSGEVWPWAIFLSAWILAGVRSGVTYLFEPITRLENPMTFWGIMGVYIILLALVIAAVASDLTVVT
ncbi:MAG: VOC family protein [Pseudomonadota bacterium]